MGEDELIVLIVFGSIFGIVVVSQLIGLAKKWIERNNSGYNDKAFDRLAKAFIKHKKESERRFQNLEAIISEEKPAKSKKSSNKELKETQLHNTIEIEDDTAESEKKRGESDSGNLRNMLKE